MSSFHCLVDLLSKIIWKQPIKNLQLYWRSFMIRVSAFVNKIINVSHSTSSIYFPWQSECFTQSIWLAFPRKEMINLLLFSLQKTFNTNWYPSISGDYDWLLLLIVSCIQITCKRSKFNFRSGKTNFRQRISFIKLLLALHYLSTKAHLKELIFLNATWAMHRRHYAPVNCCDENKTWPAVFSVIGFWLQKSLCVNYLLSFIQTVEKHLSMLLYCKKQHCIRKRKIFSIIPCYTIIPQNQFDEKIIFWNWTYFFWNRTWKGVERFLGKMSLKRSEVWSNKHL